jgi:hypothetical protein
MTGFAETLSDPIAARIVKLCADGPDSSKSSRSQSRHLENGR